MKQKFSMAMSLALILAMLFNSLALADTITTDGDVLNAGPNVSVTSCTSSHSFNGSATINYAGSTHFVSSGETVNISYSADAPISVSGPATVDIPNGWDSQTDSLSFNGITTTVPAGTANATYKVTITVSGLKQGGGTLNISDAFNVIVNCPTSTATTTTVSNASATYADASVTLSATVSPNPGGGSVSLIVNGSSAGSGSVGVGGVATVNFDPSSLNAGSYTIQANFGGSGTFTASSGSGSLTIGKASTATEVTCGAGPFPYTGLAYTPCSASVTGPGALNQSLSVSYTNNTNAGQATASANYAENNNYLGSSDTENFTIGQAFSTTTVVCTSGPFTYNGAAQEPCSASYLTSDGQSGSLTVGYTNNVNAGQATASASYLGDGNHAGSNDTENFTIGKAATTTTVTCTSGPFTYNGAAQEPCSASVTGPAGLNQSLAVTYINNVGAGQATASASYAENNNYLGSSDTKNFTIGKAATVTTVTCTAGPFTFNGLAQEPCSATVTGPADLNASVAVTYQNNINAGLATATATYAESNNYLTSTDTKTFTIDKAPTTTTVSCPAGPFTYNGLAQEPCSATVTGPALNQSLAVTYINNVGAGQATASASYAETANYLSSGDTETFTIDKAPTTTTVTCAAGPFTYNGAAQEPCSATVTGSADLNENLTVNYANNVNAGQATASASYAESANYLGSSDTENFTIGKAPTATTVTCGAGPFTYNGAAQEPCSAVVTGPAGLNNPVTVTYQNNINAGQATASASYTESANYLGSSDTENFTINKAPVTATAGSGSGIYSGSTQSPSACVVTGAYKGDLTCTNNPTSVGPNVGTYPIAPVVSGTGLSNFDITSANGSYTINAWNLVGFYQPVDMGNVWNTVKSGSTVPLKFEIFTVGTNELTDVSNVKSYASKVVACTTLPGAPEDAVETLAATGGTVLRYDWTAGQFIFNWQTPKNKAGTCYQVTVTTLDNSTITAFFKLK